MTIEKAFISDQSELTVLEFLQDEVNLSKKKLKDCLFKGGVWLKRSNEKPYRVRSSQHVIKVGDEIHIYYDAAYLKINSPRLKLEQQAQDISLWDKPDGISEAISLFSDHLNFNQVLEQSLPKEQDCHLIYPNIPYCSGPIIIAHTRRSASHLEHWILDNLISFSIKGCTNKEAFDYIQKKIDGEGIQVNLEKENEQKSPKLKHTSSTINFSINNLSTFDQIDTISEVFMHAIEELDDGRSKLNIRALNFPSL